MGVSGFRVLGGTGKGAQCRIGFSKGPKPGHVRQQGTDRHQINFVTFDLGQGPGIPEGLGFSSAK